MPSATVAGRAIVELPGFGLGISHELLEIFHWKVGVHHVQAGHFGHQRYRHKVFGRVVRQLGKYVGIDRECADVSQDKRVVVGRVGDFLHGNVAGRTRLVVHKNVLANRLGHFSRHCAGNDLGAATRRKRNHQTQWLVGPAGSLGVRERRGAGPCRRAQGGKPLAARKLTEKLGHGVHFNRVVGKR